jgi:hypothetical protein
MVLLYLVLPETIPCVLSNLAILVPIGPSPVFVKLNADIGDILVMSAACK